MMGSCEVAIEVPLERIIFETPFVPAVVGVE